MTVTGSFYSKRTNLRHLTYKLSASVNLPNIPENLTSVPCSAEYVFDRQDMDANSRFHATSGSYRNQSIYDPSIFEIDVPEYGKIRDVKVWVELIHDVRGGPGILSGTWGGLGSETNNPKQGLQGIQVALRSPNVHFESAHPLWNDPRVTSKGKKAVSPSTTRVIPELYKSSYLLWAGHACEDDLGETLGSATSSLPDEYFATSSMGAGNISTSDINLYGPYSRVFAIKNNKQNFPRVAYTTGSDLARGLWYAYFDDQGWHHEQVEGTILGTRSPSIGFDLDSLGRPHIVNMRGSSNLSLYVGMSGVWSTEVFGNGLYNHLTPTPDIKITSDNVINVSYFEQGTGLVLYRKASGSWSKEVIVSSLTSSFGFGSPVDYTQYSIVDVDREGRTHIVFTLIDEPYIYQALSSSNDGWTVGKLSDIPGFSSTITTGSLILSLDFVLGNDGTKYVTFTKLQDASTKEVFFIKSGSSGVHIKNLSKKTLNGTQLSSSQGFCTSICLDETSGQPWVSYAEIDGSIYNHVICRMNEFDDPEVFSKTVISKNNVPLLPAMHVSSDSLGNAHVVFLSDASSNTDNLRYGYVSSSLRRTQSGFSFIKAFHSTSFYHSFNTDIDMRTIFTDSSVNSNPRHNRFLIVNNNKLPTFKLTDGSHYQSPSRVAREFLFHGILKTIPVAYDVDNFMTGANVPWILDPRIPPGILYGRNYASMTSSDGIISATNFSPPVGWLTGPGGTANVGEFPTSGTQIGPADIQPVYPLLDDVYVEKVFDEPSRTTLDSFPAPRPTNLRGFRPGLRGTEIHGKWQLLIGNNENVHVAEEDLVSYRDGFWFRQFRLEFVVDSGEDISESSNNGFKLRFKNHKRGTSTRSAKRVQTVSGSAWWDIGSNDVFVAAANDSSRNYGITSDENSSNYAVFARITGSRADILSGSGILEEVQQTFLTNEFGTPYIPDSSGSQDSVLSPITIDEAKRTREIIDSVLSPRPNIAKDGTLEAHLSRTNPTQSTREEMLKKILEDEEKNS